MNTLFVVGIAALLLASVTLLMTYALGRIPRNWPYKPVYRTDDPVAFDRHLIVWWSIGGAGLLLTLVSFI